MNNELFSNVCSKIMQMDSPYDDVGGRVQVNLWFKASFWTIIQEGNAWDPTYMGELSESEIIQRDMNP